MRKGGERATAAIALFAIAVSVASAAALRVNKATDDSVCDLAPNTTEVLGRKAFIPAAAPRDEAAEAYRRLAARFIVAACASKQTLILHSEDNSSLDAAYLPTLANSLCVAAEVARAEVTSPSIISGKPQAGFELRCRITKFEKFKTDSEAREKSESTDAFIRKLQAQNEAAARGAGAAPPNADASPKRDCGKLTLSRVLAGGDCR